MNANIRNRDMMLCLMLGFFAFAVYMMSATAAYALDPGLVVCELALMADGNFARGIATLGIIIVGVGCCLGRITWGTAILVGVGVAVVLAAPYIVTEIMTSVGVVGWGDTC